MIHCKKIAAVALLALVAFGLEPVFAATYEIDPAHSSVEFKVRHLVGRVRGTFNAFSGTVNYDPLNPDAASAQAVIDAASIDTNNEKRDAHLQSADFFDVEKFPKITFVSKKADPATGKLTGDLTMHGITREVELAFEPAVIAEGKDGKKHLGGFAAATVNREDFGINYDPTGVTIGKEVTVELNIEAVQSGD